ncbi:alpha/beta fold hydrolase [Nocardioides acrostichi]|uniref:Alpha/beta fold hydrolase n=1 Tax=Nocardioides acrostichi TaxID=2784339 RepID=A0A930V0E2_9ACTN|nr:alpha/beta hydrolase [Nocardioides acrostichi]MBF4161566.1 alpha/beta fold hydrolase [Nocardioides acrostichi]
MRRNTTRELLGGVNTWVTGELDASTVPVTLLHPVGLNGRSLDPLVELLSDACVLRPDFPGHGDSPFPHRRLHLEDLVATMQAMWDAAGVRRSVVVGVSLGGMVAQGLTMREPERVAGLGLICTTSQFAPEARDALVERAALAERDMSTLIDLTLERWFSPAALAAETSVVAEARACLSAVRPAEHAAYWRAMKELDFLPPATSGWTPPPTVVVGGRADVSMPPAVQQLLAARIPGAHLVMVEGPHLVALESPHLVAPHLRDLLAGTAA